MLLKRFLTHSFALMRVLTMREKYKAQFVEKLWRKFISICIFEENYSRLYFLIILRYRIVIMVKNSLRSKSH